MDENVKRLKIVGGDINSRIDNYQSRDVRDKRAAHISEHSQESPNLVREDYVSIRGACYLTLLLRICNKWTEQLHANY